MLVRCTCGHVYRERGERLADAVRAHEATHTLSPFVRRALSRELPAKETVAR